MLNKPAQWCDREDYIFTIEKATSTLRIIADACGHGAYTSTASVEEALNLLADNLSAATERLQLMMWPVDKERSAAYLEYRRLFDAWREACDADSGGICEAGDALRDATDALRLRPIQSWNDVAELGIVAHDYAWNRFSQRYVPRDCSDDILTALILGVLQIGGRDAVLHQPPADWKPSVKGSITISN